MIKKYMVVAFLGITLSSLAAVIFDEKPIVIVITTYNTAPWIEQTLDSAMMQRYNNVEIICVDDCSTDGTVQVIKQYIEKHDCAHKVRLITNAKQHHKMYNMYNVYHSIDDWTIIVQLDGDDWFAHENVLQEINDAYQNTEVWFTYGKFKFSYGKERSSWKVPDHVVKARRFRKYPYIFTQTRSFYAWLFKCIKIQDLLTESMPGFEGKFFKISNDCAMIYPMLEMCGHRFAFIPNISYIRNWDNPLVGHKIYKGLYARVNHELCKQRNLYPMLEKPIVGRMEKYKHAHADCLIFSDKPQNLPTTLQSLQKYVAGIDTIAVLYPVASKDCYNEIARDYSTVHFFPLDHELVEESFAACMHVIHNEHIIVMRDDYKYVKPLDVNSTIQLLEKTYAHAFYYALDYNHEPFYGQRSKSVPCQEISDDVYVWWYRMGKRVWRAFMAPTATLYRTKMIRTMTQDTFDEVSFNACMQRWASARTDLNQAGLFFHEAYVQKIN